MSPALGALCALASALCWTLISLVARALAPYLNALAINMLRSASGGAILVVAVGATGGFGALGDVSGRSWVLLTLSVLTAFAIGDTAFFESTRAIGLGRALTVSTGYPLLASALGVLLLGERVTPATAAGAVVTLGGVILIVSERVPLVPGTPDRRARGVGLALLAAVAWAVSVVMIKPTLREVDPASVQAVRLPLAAVAMWLLPWARGTGGRVRAHLRATGPLLLALAVLTSVSSVTFVAGVKYAGVTLASVLSSTSPLFALPIGLIALGERVTWHAAAGAALCVGGIALLSL